MKEHTELDISIILKAIADERKAKNKHYSHRAFARDLGISSGRLSEILTKKYVPGPAVANRIIESLKGTDEEAKTIQLLIDQSKKTIKESGGAKQLSESEFESIVDWHHFAIFNMIDTVDFVCDPEVIARRLRISKEMAENSLRKLMDLGLVELRDGQIKRPHKNITTSHNIPSKLLRESQRQILEQSITSLEIDELDIRDITSITLAINPNNISKAKELARDFRRKLASLLEEGEKSEVYNICVQIVPVSR